MAKALVGIVMGSTSDWDVMKHAAQQLKDFGVAYEARAFSAHRTPDLLIEWVEKLVAGGAKCFIAGAGGAAHLAGVVASKTTLPVLAVPIPSKHLQGLDSLLSMVQMPKGIPVATFAIGDAGSANAGLFAVSMLALEDTKLAVGCARSVRSRPSRLHRPACPSFPELRGSRGFKRGVSSKDKR